MDRKRRTAWESAIAKRERGEDVPEDEHYALLREGMFDGEATPAVRDEADLFLRYWCGGMDTRKGAPQARTRAQGESTLCAGRTQSILRGGGSLA